MPRCVSSRNGIKHNKICEDKNLGREKLIQQDPKVTCSKIPEIKKPGRTGAGVGRLTNINRFNLRCDKSPIEFPNVQVCDATKDYQRVEAGPKNCLLLLLFCFILLAYIS